MKDESELIRHRASMWGYVRDATQAKVPGATVRLSQKGPGVISTVESRTDGLFLFLDLSPGDYVVAAEMGTRHGQTAGRVVAPGQEKRRVPEPVTVILQSGQEAVKPESGTTVGRSPTRRSR